MYSTMGQVLLQVPHWIQVYLRAEGLLFDVTEKVLVQISFKFDLSLDFHESSFYKDLWG